jgi:ATP-independent RNA helicase DbpA
VEFRPLTELVAASGAAPLVPAMVTIHILGGRKEKIRPGDVLGALTKDAGIPGAQVGKISVNDYSTYVAVAREVAQRAEQALNARPVKGKRVKARILG